MEGAKVSITTNTCQPPWYACVGFNIWVPYCCICVRIWCNFYSALTVIDALLTKALHTTYAPIPARTKTPNRFILHYLVISSQAVKHRPPNHAMHINCIGKKWNFYSVLTVIDALLTNAYHTTYGPIPAPTKTANRFILHYLVVSSQPVKHRPQTMQCI